ncbi:MAG: hypothetical protein LBI05_04810, partial [Planctomycetaceae bacterium]|nr:hypothetical protein [Planctomycetaceae bacterium]
VRASFVVGRSTEIACAHSSPKTFTATIRNKRNSYPAKVYTRFPAHMADRSFRGSEVARRMVSRIIVPYGKHRYRFEYGGGADFAQVIRVGNSVRR